MEAPSKHLTLKQRSGYDDVNNETKRNPAGKHGIQNYGG